MDLGKKTLSNHEWLLVMKWLAEFIKVLGRWIIPWRTDAWLITMVIVSPLTEVIPLANGHENGLWRGVTIYLLSGMILQVQYHVSVWSTWNTAYSVQYRSIFLLRGLHLLLKPDLTNQETSHRLPQCLSFCLTFTFGIATTGKQLHFPPRQSFWIYSLQNLQIMRKLILSNCTTSLVGFHSFEISQNGSWNPKFWGQNNNILTNSPPRSLFDYPWRIDGTNGIFTDMKTIKLNL